MKENSTQSYNIAQIIFVGIIVFSLMFLRSWHIVGPISARNVSAIIILILAIHKKPIYALSNNVKLYFIWVGVYILLCFIGDSLFSPVVYKNLVGYHLISIIIIFSVPRLIKNYSQLKCILIWLIIFYLFNCFITWLQYNNNPVGWFIGNYISPFNETKYEKIENMSQVDNFLSMSVCGGINGFVVTNGQFVAGFLPIASVLLWLRDKKSIILGLCFSIIAIYTAFCIQQRMAFLICAIYCFILFVYRARLSGKTLIFLAILLIICVYPELLSFDTDSLGRLFSTDDNIRSNTLLYVEQYVSRLDNIFIGNPVPPLEHDPVTLAMCHNCILDSFRRAGILGLILFVFLFLALIKECFKSFITATKNNDAYTTVFSLSCLFFLLYSLTHSSNVTSGDVFTWISYAFMLLSSNLFYRNNLLHAKSV